MTRKHYMIFGAGAATALILVISSWHLGRFAMQWQSPVRVGNTALAWQYGGTPGVVEGSMTDGNGVPIDKGDVEVETDSGTHSTSTDANGRFKFQPGAASTDVIWINHVRFEWPFFGLSLSDGLQMSIRLRDKPRR